MANRGNRVTRRDFIRTAGTAAAMGLGNRLDASPISGRGKPTGEEDASDTPPHWRKEGDPWIAANATMEVAVSMRTDTIQRLIDKVSGEDYCHQVVPRHGKATVIMLGL